MRTSQGTFISSNEDKKGVLAWIEQRLAQITGLPASHGEVRFAPSSDRRSAFEWAALASLRSKNVSLFTGSSDITRSLFAQPDHMGVFLC